jgi:hypothetical protein
MSSSGKNRICEKKSKHCGQNAEFFNNKYGAEEITNCPVTFVPQFS